MRIFKIGDKVRIKKDILIENDFVVGGHTQVKFNSDMQKYRDKILTIKKVTNEYNGYGVEECDWNWLEDWLEPNFRPTQLEDDLFEAS